MTDQNSLYRTIVASPEDDTCRLVYADWLEEHGRLEEAEFIRLDCQIDAAGPGHPSYFAWQQRLEELRLWLLAHAPGPNLKLRSGLRLGEHEWWRRTQRGFPSYLIVENTGSGLGGARGVRKLCAALEHAFTMLPTRWVVLGRITIEEWAEFLKHPIGAELQCITVSTEQPVADEAARLLAASTNLRRLRGAALVPFGEAGAEEIGRADHLSRLEWLALDPDQLTPTSIRSLNAKGMFHNLRTLIMTVGTPAPVFEELCRLPPLEKLHSLELRAALFSSSSWLKFAESVSFPKLKKLDLNQCALHQGQMALIARATHLRLSHLDVSRCSMGLEGLQALLSSPMIGSLRWLDLTANDLPPAAGSVLAEAQALQDLCHLDVSFNALRKEGLLALVTSRFLRNLLSLSIRGCLLPDLHKPGPEPLDFSYPAKADVGLLELLNTPQIRQLDLTLTPLTDAAAATLGNEKFRNLTRLKLQACGIKSQEILADLLRSPTWQNIVELDLSGNPLGKAAATLSDPGILPRLSLCLLSKVGIPPEYLAKLSRRPGVKFPQDL